MTELEQMEKELKPIKIIGWIILISALLYTVFQVIR